MNFSKIEMLESSSIKDKSMSLQQVYYAEKSLEKTFYRSFTDIAPFMDLIKRKFL